MTKGRWFRMYDAVIDDPKVGTLSDFAFRGWVSLLAVASQSGGSFDAGVPQLAFRLRMGTDKLKKLLDTLISAGLLDEVEENRLQPHNWDKFQYKSDVSTPRVKRFRNAERNVSETDPETEADTDTESKKKVESVTVVPLRPKGTRWLPGYPVSEAWKDEARADRLRHSLPDLDMDLIAEQFVNYWTARAGPGSTKLDWKRTFLNWALKEKSNGPRRTKTNGLDNFLSAARAVIEERARPADGADHNTVADETGDQLPPPRLLSGPSKIAH